MKTKKLHLITAVLFLFLLIFLSACDDLLDDDSSSSTESSEGDQSRTLDAITNPPSLIGGHTLQGYIEDLSTSEFTKYTKYYNNLTLTFPTKAIVKVDGYLEVKGTCSDGNTLAVYIEDSSGNAYVYDIDKSASGEFSQIIYFKEAGDYTVCISSVSNSYYSHYCYFTATNVPSADIHYLVPTSMAQAFDSTVMAQALELYRQSPTTDAEDVAKTVHDYLVKNLYYDFDTYENGANNPQDAVSVLANGYGVCAGYSALNAALLRACGIPARVETGTANGGSHAWNEVYWSSAWHNIDVTWDDPVMSDGNGGYTSDFTDGSNLCYTYFDISDADLAADHATDGISEWYRNLLP